MYTSYFRQAWKILKEHKLISIISIIGTGLAISLVMVIVMLYQIQTANYPPETNRDRLIFLSSYSKPRPGMTGGTNNSGFSYEMVKECIYPMVTPAKVTVTSYEDKKQLALPTRSFYQEYAVMGTDERFWDFFSFRFTAGRPYTEEEVISGLPLAVISREIAHTFFRDESPLGKELLINLRPHQIVGVVEDVTKAATLAYSQVWVPVTSDQAYLVSRSEETCGNLAVFLQTNTTKDKPVVLQELKRNVALFSDRSPTYQVEARTKNYPELKLGSTEHFREYVIRGLLVILFLMALPAVNLTGILIDNMNQRAVELGIRKAFGANKGALIKQILSENLVSTLLGALFGFILSFFFIYASRNFLLSGDTMLTMDMLLRPGTFLAVVVVCFVMNLLGALWPAWRISQKPIVESLSANDSNK